MSAFGWRYLSYPRTGAKFSNRIKEALSTDSGKLPRIFFSYDTTALEAFQFLKDKGVRLVLGQVDAHLRYFQVCKREEARWEGWQKHRMFIPESYVARREAEWKLADIIVVNSHYCHSALVEQGVPVEKIRIIPLCYEGSRNISRQYSSDTVEGRPLQVLFLGQVSLSKGVQYLIESAKTLGDRVVVNIVGSIYLSGDIIKSVPSNVRLHGPVSRDAVREWYLRSDVFVFPTLSDGFGLTQLEAMAHGLPVIATSNCGSVVRDGVDGLIVPAGDAGALDRAIARFANDRSFLRLASRSALVRVEDFSIEKLGRDLHQLQLELL